MKYIISGITLTSALLAISLALAEDTSAKSECFYCGSWRVLSRVFYGADTLEITNKTITWGPCGSSPARYAVMVNTAKEFTVRIASEHPCMLHGRNVAFIRFEPATSSSGTSSDLALYIFSSEERYISNTHGTWGIYVR